MEAHVSGAGRGSVDKSPTVWGLDLNLQNHINKLGVSECAYDLGLVRSQAGPESLLASWP